MACFVTCRSTILLSLILLTIVNSKDNHITIFSIQENTEKNLFIGILTEIDTSSTGYISSKLIDPTIIQTPQTNSDNLQFEITFDTTNKCIGYANNEKCHQKFMIESVNSNENCPLHLQGKFDIQFDVFDTNTNEIVDTITLETAIKYEDSICDSKIFNINENNIKSQVLSTQEMKFYQDETYETEMDQSDLYAPNDICFAEIIMHYKEFDEISINSILRNVWICTKGIQIDIDECDDDSYFWIIKNHQKDESLFDAQILSETDYPDSKTTVIRFSFTIPKKIQTDTLYIENQVELQIMKNDENKRLLLNSDTNSIGSILKTLTVYVFGHIHIENNIIYPYPDTKLIFIGKEWVTIVEILTVIVIFLALILIIVYCNCNNNQIEIRNENQNEDIPLKRIDKDAVDFEDFEQEYNDPLDESY